MSDNNNPYAAPSSNLEQTVYSDSTVLLDTPRSVSAGRGWSWIAEGFEYFKRSPLGWILGMVIGLIAIIVLYIIPIIGPIIYAFTTYVFVGGVMLGCHAQSRGEPFEVRHVFAGFKKPVNLILLSIAVMLIALALMLVSLGPGYFSMLTVDPEDTEAALAAMGDPATFMLRFAVSMLLFIPLTMALWFAPALVAINELSVFKAMKTSFVGCMKNVLPFLLFGIIGFVFYILAIIPIGLGLLVFLPTFTAASYVAYREIFLEQ